MNFSTSVRSAIAIALLALNLSACAVINAAKQPDKKDLTVLNVGVPRAMVIGELGHPTTTEQRDRRKIDTFAFVQGYSDGVKTSRAMFHGVADVLTLGLWEIVGTPLESIASGSPVRIEVRYDENDRVDEMVLFEGPGKRAQVNHLDTDLPN